MDCSTPGLPVHHQLLRSWWELTQTHVHWVSDVILCCPLLLLPSNFPSIRVFFKWVSSLHQVAKVLECQLQHPVLPMSIQGWFPLRLSGLISLLSKGLSIIFSNTTVQKHQFFGTQLSSQSNSHITNCTTRVQFQKWQNDLSVFKVNHSTSRNLSLCPNQCCWRT